MRQLVETVFPRAYAGARTAPVIARAADPAPRPWPPLVRSVAFFAIGIYGGAIQAGVGLILSGRGSGKTALPFGTFLAVAVILWLYAPSSWFAWSPL